MLILITRQSTRINRRVMIGTSTARVSRCLQKSCEGIRRIEVGGTRASTTAAVSRFARDQPSPY